MALGLPYRLDERVDDGLVHLGVQTIDGQQPEQQSGVEERPGARVRVRGGDEEPAGRQPGVGQGPGDPGGERAIHGHHVDG